MVAVKAVASVPLQVDIVEAGAAVEDFVIDDEALEMHDPHELAPLYRHPIDLDAGAEAARHFLVHAGVAGRTGLADQAALGAVPIDEDRDLELRLRSFRGI